MSLRADGTYRCDKCNDDVVNGGVQYAVTISGIDPDDASRQQVFHLCLPHERDDGEHYAGCRNRVLTATALAAYIDYREKGGA